MASILDEAGGDPATLIAVSACSRFALTGLFPGTTATRILLASAHPVFLVRGRDDALPPPAALTSLVVTLDGSPESEWVLPCACAFARAVGLKIILVGVLSWEVDEGKERVEAYLDNAGAWLSGQDVPDVETQLLRGDPTEAVVTFVGRAKGAVVVVGMHDRLAVRRLPVTTVNRVVRACLAPVQVVRSEAQLIHHNPGVPGLPGRTEGAPLEWVDRFSICVTGPPMQPEPPPRWAGNWRS